MFCPNCGTQFSQGQKFCRSCGTNLTIIAKAVTLSEAVGRSDRGALPKVKAALEGLKLDEVSAEISKGLQQVFSEIEHSVQDAPSPPHRQRRERRDRRRPTAEQRRERRDRRRPTAEQRRERSFVKGFTGLFSGIGLAVFLYYLAGALVLRIPPHIADRVPFEIDPVVRIIWLIGLIPALTGLGRIFAGFFIRSTPEEPTEAPQSAQPTASIEPPKPGLWGSVTEHTTELLESDSKPPTPKAARQQG